MSSYTNIIHHLYDIVGPTLLCLGTIGGILNCFIFIQKSMRKNPGSIYLFVFNFINLIVLYTNLFQALLTHFFSIDLTTLGIINCKIYYYIRTISIVLSSYYLVLASMDRTLFTSSNALIRQRSTHRLAYISITVVTTLILLYYIQIIIFADFYELFPGFSMCYYKQENYRKFATFNSLIFNSICPLIFLSIFGTLTLRNLYRTRIHPVVATGSICTNIHKPKRNRQMAKILVIEILIYVFCSSIILTFNIYVQLTEYPTNNLEQFLFSLFYLIRHIPQTTIFYVYFIVSKSFRQQTMQILQRLYSYCFTNMR
ncbi:hypothetical protein I4U23_022667 [Adineta vaga]|nr:hypothetical protein I4U23_022667 [Adineta vaga]